MGIYSVVKDGLYTGLSTYPLHNFVGGRTIQGYYQFPNLFLVITVCCILQRNLGGVMY